MLRIIISKFTVLISKQHNLLKLSFFVSQGIKSQKDGHLVILIQDFKAKVPSSVE